MIYTSVYNCFSAQVVFENSAVDITRYCCVAAGVVLV